MSREMSAGEFAAVRALAKAARVMPVGAPWLVKHIATLNRSPDYRIEYRDLTPDNYPAVAMDPPLEDRAPEGTAREEEARMENTDRHDESLPDGAASLLSAIIRFAVPLAYNVVDYRRELAGERKPLGPDYPPATDLTLAEGAADLYEALITGMVVWAQREKSA